MVVGGRGQTSVCELCPGGCFSGLGHHKATIGSRPGRGAFEEASTIGNLAAQRHSWIKGSVRSSSWLAWSHTSRPVDNKPRLIYMMTAKSDKRQGVVRVIYDLAPLDLSAFFSPIQKTNPFVEKHILWLHRQLITGYWSRSSPMVCLFKVVIESLNLKAHFLHFCYPVHHHQQSAAY